MVRSDPVIDWCFCKGEITQLCKLIESECMINWFVPEINWEMRNMIKKYMV